VGERESVAIPSRWRDTFSWGVRGAAVHRLRNGFNARKMLLSPTKAWVRQGDFRGWHWLWLWQWGLW